jgi:hypothetical protein
MTLPESAIGALVGVYRIDAKTTRTITREGSRLFSERTDGEKQEVFAESNLRLFYKDSFARLVFETDPKGKVTRVVLRDDEFEEPAVRTDESPK